MSFWDDLFSKGRFRGAPAPPFQVSAPQGKPYAMAMLDGENAEITMYGEIVEARPIDWWTGEPEPGAFIIQSEFLQDLETVTGAKNLTIRMSSIGGDAGVSILIHNRLRDMAAKGTHLKCIVDGVAMSGGSLIMCACDEVEVNPSSLIMIHNAACTIRGGHNANSLRQRAMALDAWDKAQVSIYKRKTGLSEDLIAEMMANTTYMTGIEAKEGGFADKLLEDAEPLGIAASADKRSLFVRGKQFHLTPGMFAPDNIPTVSPGQEAGAAINRLMAKMTVNPEASATDTTNKIQPVQTGNNEGGKLMALIKLREEDPEAFKQLMAKANAAASASSVSEAAPIFTAGAEAVSAAVQAERKRIEEIDAVASLYDAETVKAAKYGKDACTAQEMTYRAAQKAAQQGKKFLSDLDDDAKASGAQSVSAVGDPGTPPPAEAQTPDQRMANARAEVKALLGKEGK